MFHKNKFKLLKLTIIISVILSFFAAKLPMTLNFSSVTLYVSAVTGYAGIMLLLWTFILGTRSVITLFSNDYIRIIKAHSWIGKYGMLTIFIHPILVMLSYSESLLFIFLPNYGSEFENAVTFGRSAFFIIIIIWISSALLKSKVSNRPWKYLHLAAYFAVPFTLLHIPDTGSSYASIIGAKIYFFVVVVGFGIFGLLRLRGVLNLNKTKYEIVSNHESAQGIFTVALKPAKKEFIKIKPGQYVYIKSGRLSEDHPFSLLDYNNKTGQIVIGYKVYGYFTKKLSSLTAGNNLLLSGPYGTFTGDITTKPVVFIAGGIGVTPFMSRIIHESNNREQWLFYTNKNKDLAAYINIIKNYNTKLVEVYSREKYADHEFGHVDADLIKKYLSNPTDYPYYICGPDKMTKDIIEGLKQLSVTPANIHYEIF